jgi:hypothetical protein
VNEGARIVLAESRRDPRARLLLMLAGALAAALLATGGILAASGALHPIVVRSGLGALALCAGLALAALVWLARAPRPAHAAVFEAEALVLEGGPGWRSRRVELRDVWGIERAGAALWVGAGFAPAVLGGRDVPGDRLDAVAAQLRARIAALPGGAERLARIDARRDVRVHLSWLTAALALALLLDAFARGAAPGVATGVLWMAALGVLLERFVGALRLLASGVLGLVAAWAFGAELRGDAPLVLAAGWLGLLGFARLRREPLLPVRARSAFELAGLLALALALPSLAAGPSLLGLAAALGAGFAAAKLVLRGWPSAR